MAETLKEIKEKLQELGISTDTPGIKGHDRREELANRLEEALFKKDPKRSPRMDKEDPPISNMSNFAVPDMANLSMAEIRSRLTMLGESTATPGLSGEDRRRTLIKRLMESICGNDGGDDESGSDAMNRTFEQRLDREISRPDPSPVPSPVERSDNGFASPKNSPIPSYQPPRATEKTQEEIDNENLAQLEQTCNLERKKISDLGDAKKRMTALANKRSMMISARFSGPMQDERLREVSKRLTNAESELLRVQTLIAKEGKKHPPGGGQVTAKASSDLVNEGKPMDLEKLASKLIDIKEAIKDKVKWHKTRIRCDEENHEEYGVESENIQQNKVQEINFEISKIKRQIDIERARVGKAAVARWDLRQKELKAQQKHQEQLLQQQVAPSSIEEEEEEDQRISFGHHGFPDEDDDIDITGGGSGGGGMMFGPDVNFDDLDSQFNSMLTSGKREEDFDAPTADLNNYGDYEDYVPVGLSQKAPSPPKPPLKTATKVPVEKDASKHIKKPPAKQFVKQAIKAPPKPVQLSKKGAGAGSKVANDQDLDAFISKMDPNNPANQLSTDDDVLEKKLTMLRQRSGLADIDRSAPPSKEDINNISPKMKPAPRSSSQKTVLTSDSKPIVSKKSSFEESPTAKATSSKAERYRGEAEITKMMEMKDDDLLKKTKELEKQMKSMAAAAKKTKDRSTRSSVQEESKKKVDIASLRSAAAPPIVSPFDPKKASKMYKNKNRPPAQTEAKVSTRKQEESKESIEHSDDAWKRKGEGDSSDDDDDDDDDCDDDDNNNDVDGGDNDDGSGEANKSDDSDSEEHSFEKSDKASLNSDDVDEMKGITSSEKDVVMQVPVVENAEPTVLSPSDKVSNLQMKDLDDDDNGQQEMDSDDDDSSDSEEQRQVDADVKSLRLQAVEQEKLGKYDDVEEILLKALELNPMDMRSLDAFATFLHRKRGELGRAEAFYRRAIQVCVPSLMDELKSPRESAEDLASHGGERSPKDSSWRNILDRERRVPGDTPINAPTKTKSIARVHLVTQVLLHYATFLRRAKGDIEVAGIVLRKAADISPSDAVVLGSCAHHLVEDNMSPENIRDATDMFKRALKNDPANINNFLWYAKLLHKTGKLSEAELMFKVAMTKTRGEGKMGAAATCNYAMFLYKYRNKVESADIMFKEGLEMHPRHKGLIKGYKAMLRDMKAKKLKSTGKTLQNNVGNELSTASDKEDTINENEGSEEDDCIEYTKPEKKKRDKKERKDKKEKRKKEKRRSANVEGDPSQSDVAHTCAGKLDDVDDHDKDVDNDLSEMFANPEIVDDEAGRSYVTKEESNKVETIGDEMDGDSDNNKDKDEMGDLVPTNGLNSDDVVVQSPVTGTTLSPCQDSPSALPERTDSRGSNSSRASSRGLRARLYDRVNSAGSRSTPLESTSDEGAEVDCSKRRDGVDENDDVSTECKVSDENEHDDLHSSVTKDGENEEEEDTTQIADIDSDNLIATEEVHTTENLMINTSFGTEEGELPDDLDDEVTAPDTFTQELENRGVITPHQTLSVANVTSDEKPIKHSVDDGGESVEISFLDVTCYDIYMFHLRQTHGENIEADAQNRISLYWTVKVYPDTYWEHETGTQRVSDEKNSAIWRFPSDNDDSFAMKSNLHLCFLLFEATNDTLLGSAIFPGQDVVNAGLAGGDEVFEIDDEIICEDGVTVIGQLQANVKFVR